MTALMAADPHAPVSRDGFCSFRGDAPDRHDRDGDRLHHAPEALEADDFSRVGLGSPLCIRPPTPR